MDSRFQIPENGLYIETGDILVSSNYTYEMTVA